MEEARSLGTDLHACHEGPGRPRRDVNFDTMATALGEELARLQDITISLYLKAAAYAGSGILIADTKFEFGLDEDGGIVGRRGAHAGFVALLGQGPLRDRRLACFVRQAVRARLARGGRLGQAAAGPELPEAIVKALSSYREAFEILTAPKPRSECPGGTMAGANPPSQSLLSPVSWGHHGRAPKPLRANRGFRRVRAKSGAGARRRCARG
jgi:hypothetical protein